MSRSYCKPIHPYHLIYKNELNWTYRGITEYDLFWVPYFFPINEAKWKYYTKKHTNRRHSLRFPRYYRKQINKSRRNYDKRELFKEVNFIDYEGLYDKWNCKTADPWWFW